MLPRRAVGHWTCFVHDYRAPHQLLTMTSLDGPLRGGIIPNLYKTESASLSGDTIAHDSHRVDGHAIFGKEALYIRLICRIWEVSDEELLHFAPRSSWKNSMPRMAIKSQKGGIVCYTVLSCLLCPQARFDFGGILPPESERVGVG